MGQQQDGTGLAEIASIKAQLAAITPWPWVSDPQWSDPGTGSVAYGIFAADETGLVGYDGEPTGKADAEFIAAAPTNIARLIALVEQAWNDGHEAGFWNGRESAGSGEMEACGVEHAKLTNPYTQKEG
jgi:hypothetical protein